MMSEGGGDVVLWLRLTFRLRHSTTLTTPTPHTPRPFSLFLTRMLSDGFDLDGWSDMCGEVDPKSDRVCRCVDV